MGRLGAKMSDEDVATWPDLPTGGGPAPASSVVAATTFGLSPAAGTATQYARQDHTHGAPADPIPAHVAVSNPHTQYQLDSAKGVANGYPSLDAGTKIPIAQVPTGSTASTVCLGNDGRLSDARTPLAHGHPQSEVTGLVTDLGNKQAVLVSGTNIKTINGSTVLGPGDLTVSGSAAWGSVTGTLSSQTDLQTALNGKAASTHSHPQSEVTNLVTDLAGKAASVHSHAQSEVTNLTTDLAAKQATLVSGTNIKTINGSSVLGAGNLVVGGGASINTLRTTVNQTINAGAGVFTDITGLTFPVVAGTDYAFEFYITFQSAATTTGWRAGVNCPAGTLDFWAGSDVIANGAAGVATHTERHNTVRDDMTLLTATITQAVDLNVRIRGRYLCTANGTFAARFANELASNTQIVVQKGSWGWWF